MKNRKAFTLLEILIVVVILGILAAVIIPQFTKNGNSQETDTNQPATQPAEKTQPTTKPKTEITGQVTSRPIYATGREENIQVPTGKNISTNFDQHHLGT